MHYISNRALFACILLSGMFFPTSLSGSISIPLYGMAFVVSAVFLAILALRTGCDWKSAEFISAPIVIWLIVCTFLSLANLHGISLVPLALFALLAFMFCLKPDKLECGDLKPLLATVSIVNICLGIGMLAIESVSSFMLMHYSNFYDDLLSNMLAGYKPVTVFTSHSIAGMFAYLFFFLNFRTYQQSGKKLYLWLAILHVAMCLLMMSSTSLVFSLLAVAQLVYAFKWKSLVFAPVLLLIPADWKEFVTYLFLIRIWFNEGSGFLGRYGGGGNQLGALAYIAQHPFAPIGFTFTKDFFIGDSGPIEYMLRGSLLLVLLIYGGLFWFLRRNLPDKWDCYHLFAVILAAEVGFTMLTYIRSYLLIPAFVVYLNSISNYVPPYSRTS